VDEEVVSIVVEISPVFIEILAGFVGWKVF
jgi:hypothetical protein